MASALIRAAERRVSPVRAASASSRRGESASASNRPSSLAANRCFAAMKPAAMRMIGSGVARSCGLSVSARSPWPAASPRSPGRLGAGVPDFWECPDRRVAASYDLVDHGCRTRARRQDRALACAADGLGWLDFAAARPTTCCVESVPFDRTCWHTVDPGTVLFTGSLNRERRLLGDLAGRARVRDRGRQQVVVPRPQRPTRRRHQHRHPRRPLAQRPAPLAVAYGIGDELRVAFVADGTYWGAAGLLRDARPAMVHRGRRALPGAFRCGEPIGARRSLVHACSLPSASAGDGRARRGAFRRGRRAPSRSRPAAEHWIAQMVEAPPPAPPAESQIGAGGRGQGPRARPWARTRSACAARARVRTRAGTLAAALRHAAVRRGGGRTAVDRPARRRRTRWRRSSRWPTGLSEREREVTRLCMEGRSTKEMAAHAAPSPRTPCRTTSSRSSARPVCAPGASSSARCSSSTTSPAGSGDPTARNGGRSPDAAAMSSAPGTGLNQQVDDWRCDGQRGDAQRGVGGRLHRRRGRPGRAALRVVRQRRAHAGR